MKLEDLARQCGEWLRGSGPESDIVISSRIRLARNLADFPFIRQCNEADRSEVEKSLKETIYSIKKWKNYEKYFEGCHQYLEKWVSDFAY